MENPYIQEQMDRALKLLNEEKPDEALAIYEMIDLRSAGEIQRAVVSNDIGWAFKKMGLYKEAMQKYRFALDIYEKNHREPLENYIVTSNNLAVLLHIIGEYKKAEEIYKHNLDLVLTNLGERSETYAIKINNLGYFYLEIGKYDIAERLFIESKNLRKELFGENSIKYLQGLNNLAGLYKQKKDYEKALVYFKETVRLMEVIKFTSNTHYYKALENLCWLFIEIGEYEEATSILNKIHEDSDINKGYQTLEQSKLLLDHVRLSRKINHPEDALKMIEDLSGSYNANQTINTLFYSDILYEKSHLLSEVGDFEAAFQTNLVSLKNQNDIFLNTSFSFSEHQSLDFLRKINREYNLILNHLITHFSTDQNKVMETYLNIILRKSIILEMTMIQNILLRRFESDDLSSENVQERFKKEYIDKLLHVDYEKILNRLDSESWFLDYYYTDESDQYILFLISPDQPIRFINLGNASEINRLIDAYRNSILCDKDRGAHQRLSIQLLSKLFPFDVENLPKKIIISPVNEISTLPFETFLDEEGYFLIEKTFVKYISSVKDIVQIKKALSPKTVSIVSNPDFDYLLDNVERDTEPNYTQPSSEALSYRGSVSDDDYFKRLKGMEVEGEIVAKILQAAGWQIDTFLSGRDACVSKVKQLKDSNIIHIISHGYTTIQSQYSKNPLKDCGLVFSGINTLLRNEKTISKTEKEIIEDGVLTAYDMTFMNFENTELMVLSACNTGLGKIENGNGILGFQRAVLLTGVKRLLITLFQVPDRYSSELIEIFYSEYIMNHDAESALRNAKLKLIDHCYKTIGHADPYLWGGYVCLSRSF